jgi:cytochrome P450
MSIETSRPLTANDLQDPAVRANPYPLYRRLLTEDPVHWEETPPRWVVTRYADVVGALRDPRMSAARLVAAKDLLPEEEWDRLGPVVRSVGRQMLFVDPPDHTRLRGLVSKAFTPRRIEQMRGRIQQLVDDLLDAALARGELDVIRDLAYPLPATVIIDMLGVPRDEIALFKKGSDDFAAFLGTFLLNPEAARKVLEGIAELLDYFRRDVASRRARPGDDLLSAMIAANEQGDQLDEEELFANSLLLLAAGHETTTNLIGNGTLALLRHPDQLRHLRDDPTLLPGAVEELLRYDPPVQMTSRMAREDLALGGKAIAKGQRLSLFLAAANRDPAQFRDPDRLDVTRPELRNASFGYGIHFCLGAPLARLEGEIALGTLIRRFPNLRLEIDTPEWHDSVVFRGLKRLPVRV